ncbi:hypothetical protein BDQ12DRAFT_673119 [Crucibulum laeve]|uniref:Protein kinase domain-containing protein n=1 Tax=Crucibulum laeve TaxID=68775 RepID=A0A5C3MJC9_9AGAR|nr:hypothetical protein BDQ12DRAFT_673119 [Crucibulum laeve]
MEYLRTLGSAAVSSLVQKSGLNLPFSLGIKVTTLDGLCNLYDGTKRDDGSAVSIFEYDFSDPAKKQSRTLAQNTLRKLRTTRHPDILKFMDAVESETLIYIMTERVRPLQSALASWSSRNAQEKEDWLLWGLHRISIALTFLNEPCASTHGKICTSSIFISPSGEWKLGGFELLSNPKDDAAVLYSMGGLVPGSSSWASPEVKKGGWSALKDTPLAAPDAYALGLLLHAVFNPSHPQPATAEPPHPPPTSSSRGMIPSSVFVAFKKLLNPNPKNRLTASSFLELGMAENGFFATNRLVKVCLGLDNFTLGSEAEKTSLLRTLKETASSFPPEFASYRVLPSLISALEFGGASAAAILPLVLQFGKNVSPEDYPNVILAPLIKLFGSPDRGTRMALLEHLPEYVDKLDKKAVSDKIFPHLQTGFADTVAVIREATTKSIILLAPKLNDRILNNDLLRLLAKMQMDPEPSIRTNTCILIGRLGPSLGYNTKRKVLVPAFSRALKDSFVHARVAGLMAFMATMDCFEVEEIATKVLPNMAFTMVDKEKLVRDQAFKAVELFVKKLEQHAAMMPDTVISEGESSASAGPLPAPDSIVNSAAGAAGALAGWAISSLGKKLATSELQSAMSPGIDRPISAPAPPGGFPLDSHIGELRKPSFAATTSTPTTPVTNSASISKARGLQLGATKQPASALADRLAAEAAAINSGETTNPWGNDDLIDVNADEGDWSAFESAPVVIEPKPISASNGGLPSVLNGSKSPRQSTDIDPWNNSSSQPESLHADPWQDTQASFPTLSVQPRKTSSNIRRTQSPASSGRLTPVSSPQPVRTGWDDASSWDDSEMAVSPVPLVIPSMAGMSKEEKAAEMIRRKEERKQRIALLKEQKKNSSKT